MKMLTPNLLKFAIVAALLTVLFRYLLSSLLSRGEFPLLIPLGIGYFIAMFVSGWIFGKKDYEYLPMLDFSFRIHFITYVICNVIGQAWFLLGLQSHHESVRSAHMMALLWGIALTIHFVIYLTGRKHRIKGLNKTDLFE